jgi:signal transduction histidine kinase/ligand-binding sensor domain-containing protein
MGFTDNQTIGTAKPRVCKFLIVLTFIVSPSPVPAHAVNPDLKISQYAHTAWRLRDGYFNDKPSPMAQTKDGYMWMGTQVGLLRFDGVRFVSVNALGGRRLPSGRVTALLGANDGRLWIGTGNGLAEWKDNTLIINATIAGAIRAIHEDAQGTIWVARDGGSGNSPPVCRISSGNTKCFGEADGVPHNECCAESLALDESGNVWVGTNDMVLQIRGDSLTVHKSHALVSNPTTGVDGLAASADGYLWVGMALAGAGRGLQRLVNGVWKPFVTPQLDGSSLQVTDLLMDHNGSLWVGTVDKGIYRIHGDNVDHFGNADGLTSDFVNWIYEDREGDIWFTTPQGLDSFRDVRVATWSKHEGLTADNVVSVLAARNGAVWVGNAGGLDSIKDKTVSSIRKGKGLPGDQVTALLEDHTGRLWVGIDNRLTIYQGGRFKEINGRDGRPTSLISALTEDNKGNIWAEAITDSDHKLLRIYGDRVQEEFLTPQTRIARSLAADSQGNIWMGLRSGGFAVSRQGQMETIPHKDGSGSRVRVVLVEADGSVLGATTSGVIGWRNGKMQSLTIRNGLPCDTTYALVLDEAGDLWISTSCGIVEIEKTELSRWWSESESKLRLRTFDVFDGVQPGGAYFDPAATRSTDGRIWFASGSVLQVIDPARLAENPIPPPVHIEELFADRKRYPSQDGIRLPKLTRDLVIDYTALSFVVPQKVRFRYKLDGHDTEWQEPGTRRQAFYNDLRPGTYRFRVIACNNDGVWNEVGANVAFEIAPAFYQTSWFQVVCGISAAGILWLLYVVRMKQTSAQIHARLAERMEERARIARELHDTLLQGVQGLMLTFRGVLKTIPNHEPAHRMMEDALDRADGVLLEGRERVRELRGESSETDDLSTQLARCGEDLAQGTSVKFDLAIAGAPEAVDPIVHGEVYRIGREALVNAFQHSNAASIEVEITYGRSHFSVRIRDDGEGIRPEYLNGGRDGHWGLSGMRERAQKIGARFNIWSHTDSGTEIDLTVPAKLAYLPNRKVRRWFHKSRPSDK